jgi:uncharacterized coiled-coil DUF342 family protein
MSNSQKPSENQSVHEQIQQLRQQLAEGNAHVKSYAEKRDQLHEKVRKAYEEINALKKERDTLNEKVRALKQLRDEIRTQKAPIMDEVKALNDKNAEIRKSKLPRASQHELQEQLNAIEWKIQTTSLDLQEEKRLIENVKELETQLSGYRKIDRNQQKINEILAQRKTLDEQADVFHKELTELAEKSQNLHAVMMEKIEAAKKDKAEADQMHQNFVHAKDQTNIIYEYMRQLIDKDRNARILSKEQIAAQRREEDAKRKEQQAKKAAEEQAIKEKLGNQAREKLSRGEKLSWDEFQLVMGDKSEDEPDTQA